MQTLVLELVAFLILCAGAALLFRVGGRRLLHFGTTATVCLLLATAGGWIGAPFWWMAAPASFAWTPAPLAFRLLAVAGITFGAVGLAVLRHPTAAAIRLVLRMLAVYLVLVAVLLVLHRDRLDWSAPISWAFCAVAGGLALGSAVALVRLVRLAPPGPGPSPQPGERLVWGLAAVLFGAWGVALYLTAQGPVAAIWLWPQDALTSRLIGTMLLTLALVALEARARADLGRLAALVFAVYGLGVAATVLLAAWSGRPLLWAYLLIPGLAGLGGVLRLIRR